MAKGIIGEPFTFTVLFVDSDGDPFDPTTSVTVEAFYFDSLGDKQSLIAAGTAMSSVSGDTGRYAYTFTIPSSLTIADQIYAVMTGVGTPTGEDIVAEEFVDPFEAGGGEIEIEDEGVALGSFSVVNFVGADVEVSDVGGVATIYIPPLPPPTYSSHWDTSDGDNGDQSVTESISRSSAHISTPSGGEGTPFKTGGWAGSDESASLQTSATFTTPSDTTGFGGDATAQVTVYDADGTSVLDTYTTPALTGDGANTSASGDLVVTISSYGTDDPIYPDRQKANMSVAIAIGDILTTAGLEGGRYHVEVIMTPDTTTDGSGPYTYTQTAVFLDTDPTTPSISGAATITETAAGVVTKELSGLSYYDTGSEFTVSVGGVDQLNRNTSRTSANLVISTSSYGLPAINACPFGSEAGNFSGWGNDENTDAVSFTKTDWAITSTDFRSITTTATVSSQPQDTWNSGAAAATSAASIMVDTYGTASGDLTEYFTDEDRRQDSTYNGGATTGNWVSATALAAAEALVYAGEMMVPNQAAYTDWTTFNPGGPDYGSLGAPASYYRTFIDSAGTNRSGMTLNFAGTFLSDATTDLAAEELKVYVRRRASASGGGAGPSADALRVHGSLYNFATFDDGATEAGSYTRESSSSGNTVNITFGGFSCETGVFIEIEIVNPAIAVSSLVLSFT